MRTTNDLPRDARQWYVVHCNRQSERRAAAALEELLGMATYLPEVRRRFRGCVQQAPLFPGYLFAHTNLGEVALSRINATPGVLRLVAFDERPLPVAAAIVAQIRERVDELNAQGGLVPHNFHPGDTVRMTHGPLQGFDAIFLGPMKPTERVRVLIDFLGQQREAEVRVDLLERSSAVSSAVSTPVRERRTRGRGRVIRRH